MQGGGRSSREKEEKRANLILCIIEETMWRRHEDIPQ
jgi:hypothetical protein